MTAYDIRAYRTVSARLVRAEERCILLKDLMKQGVCLREEEDFLQHVRSKFRSKRGIMRKKEIGILL